MIEKLKRQWFLVGLAVIFGAVVFDSTGTLAGLGGHLKALHGSSAMIVIIFLFSGLIIETHQIRAGIKDGLATAASLFMIVLAAPALALCLSNIPLETGIVLGLFLVSVMPTTLSSGVVLTGKAGGNMAHALFVTIVSNLLAIVSIPLILPFLIRSLELSFDLAIDRQRIFFKLVLFVLFPLVTGLVIKRNFSGITPSRKRLLGILNQCCVLVIVYMSLSGARGILVSADSGLYFILPLVAGFHVILFCLCFLTSRVLGIDKGKRESVLFMGSQKTLPLAVMLQMACFPEYPSALLVCVIHHITHLMIDGYIATRIR